MSIDLSSLRSRLTCQIVDLSNLTLKDLKADVGIDVSYNGENIRMSDIPFKDGIKTKCGLRYDLNIEHNGKNCIFELFINENYEDIIEEED